MKNFRDLKVWEKSHLLVTEIYKKTEYFPKEEKYGLINQIRRASVSVPTNIAEGCGRGSNADFKRFLQIAFGSASEVEYLLLLSYDLSLFELEEYTNLNGMVVEVKMMLAGLMKTL
ncbi:MAG: four helix bundle protein [Saprospiraceae bacterium]|nr:four helix bundle protein [Saprospiraceae bacterium]WKZ64412.1 MAG: four helix bundle protein [Saprospiraceae bacterium]